MKGVIGLSRSFVYFQDKDPHQVPKRWFNKAVCGQCWPRGSLWRKLMFVLQTHNVPGSPGSSQLSALCAPSMAQTGIFSRILPQRRRWNICLVCFLSILIISFFFWVSLYSRELPTIPELYGRRSSSFIPSKILES